MHKYSCGNELCLITSHDCYPQGSRLGLSAFMKLTLESGEDSLNASSVSNSSLRLAGSYFVSGQSDDELFQARSGRIVFTRQISSRTSNL